MFSLDTSTVDNASNQTTNSEGELTWVQDRTGWGSPVIDKEYCFQTTDERGLDVAFDSISSSESRPATSIHYEDGHLRRSPDPGGERPDLPPGLYPRSLCRPAPP